MVDLSPNQINLFDKKIELIVSSDKLSVKMKISKFKWPQIKSSEVTKYLESKKILNGIQKDIIKQAIAERDKEFIVAQGTPATPGTDGSYEIIFKSPQSQLAPKKLDNGEVDHRELDAIICVTKDEILSQIVPAIQGIPGVNVFGDLALPEKVREPEIQPGENTYYQEQDHTLRAAIGGLPRIENGMIHIKDTVTLDQDVDYSIGNIRVPCNLIIKGSVQEGFTVVASGHIQIRNEINNAFVSCGGNLTVGKGVNNKSLGKIYVDGDMSCKYLNCADLWVNGNLNVDREILFSNITCNGNLVCTREEGVVIGGNIFVEKNMIVNEIGTKLEAANTRITICDMEDYIQKTENLDKEKSTLDESLIKILKELKGVQEYLESSTITQEESVEFKGIYADYLSQANGIKKKIDHIVSSKEELKTIIKDKKSGEIQIKSTIYPGVRIKIKDAFLLTKYEEKRIVFMYNAKKRSVDTKLL